jgi:hypothetical protein
MEHLALSPTNGYCSGAIRQKQRGFPTGGADRGRTYTSVQLGQAELTVSELEYLEKALGVSLKSILA